VKALEVVPRTAVMRFSLQQGYDPPAVYYWVADRRTPVRFVDRLAIDLRVTKEWLLAGDRQR
jgi:hypothetical protein